jgi:hypothetical protein
MCGPFVLSQSRTLERLPELLLLPYHLGRITTYIALAVIFHSFLNLAYLFLPQKNLIIAPVLMLAGTLFLINAFPALHKLFPWAVRLSLPVPRRAMDEGLRRVAFTPALLRPYMMGLLLGLMPCGLVMAALMAAATAPHWSTAALSMGAFGLGTIPALVAVAFGGRTLRRAYPNAAQRFSQGLVVFSGLWLFALAGLLLM